MKKKIAVLAGDGIGPEVMSEALNVLNVVAEKFGHDFEYQEAAIGGAAWAEFGEHFPEKTAEVCGNSDAILFGSVGGPVDQQMDPKWKNCETNSILAVRKYFGFNVNLRPAKVYSALKNNCVLRADIVEKGIDILCLRELLGCIYFGEHESFVKDGKRSAMDVMRYDEDGVRSVAHAAFQAAMKRRKKVTSIDKANVLDCSKLWRTVVEEVAKEYPQCTLEHILVDNMAMQVIIRPYDFDVVLMPNMFGDIISDEVSVFAGSLGMLPSASLNEAGFGLYEPSGGSAPDIAGKNIANPIAQILSAAMMLKYSFGLDAEHDAIVNAVEETLNDGYRTGDIASREKSINEKIVGTKEMGKIILNKIKK